MIEERHPVDLLVAGALAIDRIGTRTVAGGSVLYASEAVAAAGRSVVALTIGGGEPAAVDGLQRLAAMTTFVEHYGASQTTRFVHEPGGAERVLTLEARAERFDIGRHDPAGLVARWAPRALLLAPIFDEVDARFTRRLTELLPHAYAAASIQGWLRRQRGTGRVEPLPLDALDPALREALGALRLLVASQEDLAADGRDVHERLDRLRAWSGPGPELAVTMATAGAVLDGPRGRQRIRPPRVVEGVPTIGAGDAFAAVLAAERGAGNDLEAAALRAAAVVADLLAERQAT